MIFGCVGAMFGATGGFVSAVDRYLYGDYIWAIVAIASGTVVLVAGAFVLLQRWQGYRLS